MLVREVECLPHLAQKKDSSYRRVKVCYMVQLDQPPTTYPGWARVGASVYTRPVTGPRYKNMLADLKNWKVDLEKLEN